MNETVFHGFCDFKVSARAGETDYIHFQHNGCPGHGIMAVYAFTPRASAPASPILHLVCVSCGYRDALKPIFTRNHVQETGEDRRRRKKELKEWLEVVNLANTAVKK